jgi:hypothetical protein
METFKHTPIIEHNFHYTPSDSEIVLNAIDILEEVAFKKEFLTDKHQSQCIKTLPRLYELVQEISALYEMTPHDCKISEYLQQLIEFKNESLEMLRDVNSSQNLKKFA